MRSQNQEAVGKSTSRRPSCLILKNSFACDGYDVSLSNMYMKCIYTLCKHHDNTLLLVYKYLRNKELHIVLLYFSFLKSSIVDLGFLVGICVSLLRVVALAIV